MYATDCIFQNKIINEIYFTNLNFYRLTLAKFKFNTYTCSKELKMNNRFGHHGHHRNNQSTGRL